MYNKVFIQVCVILVIIVSLLYCEEYLEQPEDFKKLDIIITKFLRDPTKEGWEENLKKIDSFLSSMRNMIMVLNGTLPGLSKDYLNKVQEFYKNDKPIFIDTNVVEYELQPLIKVTDEEFTKLYWLRLYAEKEWELLCEMMKDKTKLELSL